MRDDFAALVASAVPTNVPMRSTYHTKHGRSDKSRTQMRSYEKTRERSRGIPPTERRMIAWDGEGIKLSGPNKPQHYVLFGCSADVANPLLIDNPKGNLECWQLIDYATKIKEQYPTAFHVGFAFGYDQNMIVRSLSGPQKLALYEKNRVRFKRGETTYIVSWIPKKRITLTKKTEKKKVTIRIEDMFGFFGTSFIKAYVAMFPESANDSVVKRVQKGKDYRASNERYSDIYAVTRYWREEIVLIERLAEKFKEVIHEVFPDLKEWYGPGALANLMRRQYDLTRHEWGGKEANLPAAVHMASKTAYFGGHVEQFKAGRIKGPVYVYDINSAYPAALFQIPSMREGGIWRQVDSPSPGVTLGVYRVQFHNRARDPMEVLAPLHWQPLPVRDAHANIAYPGIVDGWYWMPEAKRAALRGGRILDGWEWWPDDPTERPWAFLESMYVTRKALKKKGSPVEMAYKLGPNSMYGKLAQRAGYDKEKGLPPRAHTLPIAGFITSACRAWILDAMLLMDSDKIIAVETDGIFSTQSPDEIGITLGEGLGEWGVKVYDEMLYVQNGLYLYRVGQKWESKTRGMAKESVSYEAVSASLQSWEASTLWQPVIVQQKEVFLGLGTSIARSRVKGRETCNWFKVQALHCTWREVNREMVPGLHGKRRHLWNRCKACKAGLSANEGAHDLSVHWQGTSTSYPYRLPWEKDYEPEWWREVEESDELLVEQT